jgi:hypothetical protein
MSDFSRTLLIPLVANIVALNFCYDVRVKLYWTNLFLMAIYLLLPDIRWLDDRLKWMTIQVDTKKKAISILANNSKSRDMLAF